jgi:hypothetical protein
MRRNIGMWLAGLLCLVVLTFNLEATAKGGPAGSETPIPSRYDCFVGATRVFADRLLTSQPSFCQPLTAEAGWDEAAFNSLMMVLYDKEALRKDGNSVDVRLAFRIAEIIQGSDGSFSYDGVKASYHLDCQARTQQMSGGVYLLQSKEVHGQTEAESVIEPVKPGTVSDIILNKMCFGIDQHEADKARFADDDDPDFVCPEYFADGESQKRELQKFLTQLAARKPQITIAEVVKARYENLIVHRCQKTLNYMATHNNQGGG